MAISTTTLPVQPIRLGGNQPIRRRALMPVAVEPAEETTEETETTETTEGPGDDDNDQQNPETDVAAEAQEPVAAPAEPLRRGRGRPRKVVVPVAEAAAPAEPVEPVEPTPADLVIIGAAAVVAHRLGVGLAEYVDAIRATVEAYDRVFER
jgi:hypothetical protein